MEMKEVLLEREKVCHKRREGILGKGEVEGGTGGLNLTEGGSGEGGLRVPACLVETGAPGDAAGPPTQHRALISLCCEPS